MYIKNIEWLDQNEEEAITIVSDTKYEITCFADGLQQGINDELTKPLECVIVKNIIRSDEEDKVEKTDSSFGYHLCGRLLDRKSGLMVVGQIKLHIKPELIPGDIDDDEQIEFDCCRIDIWEAI